jgi:uncharacterized protein
VNVSQGRFVWHELVTSDVDRARVFYSELFGWGFEPSNEGDPRRGLLTANGAPVAGLAELPAVAPQWIGYVSVDDVDRVVRAARETRGRVALPPAPSDGGRCAVLLDPSGAPITVWGAPSPRDEAAPGLFCWDELSVPDPESVIAFYDRVLGWSNAPMRSNPGTWVFRNGGRQVASLVRANGDSTAHWLTHVLVENLKESQGRAERLGGKIHIAEQPVPGVGRFSVIIDSVGARIALFEASVRA